MKYRVLLLFLIGKMFIYSQELINFYAEPVSSNTISVHTAVFRLYFSTFESIDIETIDNVITLSVCYQNTSGAMQIYDQQEHLVSLPSGYNNYTIIIDIYGDNNGLPCTYTNLVDSGTINITTPYLPTSKTYIPDFTFEDYLESISQGDDIANNDFVFTHRIENMRLLHLDEQLGGLNGEVSDMTGIEYFNSLSRLWCNDNSISNLNMSYNSNLELLKCYNNPLSQIDVTDCLNLKQLWISFTNITELDISNNTYLEKLYCSQCNNLPSVDLVNNNVLNTLFFSSDIPSTLDISQNVELTHIALGGDNISNIDFSQNINLKYISITGTQLSEISLTNNLLLEELRLSYTPIISSNLNNNTNLIKLDCEGGELSSLDVTGLTNLTDFYCNGNLLTNLDLSTNSGLNIVQLLGNNLSSLNIKNGNNPNLSTLVTLGNYELYCIDVDDEDEAPNYGWAVDSHTSFSNNCASIGTNEENIIENISIYPNPTNGILNFQSEQSILKIEVYNNLGQLIISKPNDNELNISKLNQGLYFIKFTNRIGDIVNKKIIKIGA